LLAVGVFVRFFTSSGTVLAVKMLRSETGRTFSSLLIELLIVSLLTVNMFGEGAEGSTSTIFLQLMARTNTP
jgi:hypothetical protein